MLSTKHRIECNAFIAGQVLAAVGYLLMRLFLSRSRVHLTDDRLSDLAPPGGGIDKQVHRTTITYPSISNSVSSRIWKRAPDRIHRRTVPGLISELVLTSQNLH